jgi:membrane associated rhomboid family serine protease
VLLFIGLGVIQALTLSATDVSLAAHLGGMLAGFLLVTGAWRPSKLVGWVRMAWLRFRYRRLKSKLRMVEPDDKRGPTLH